MIHHYMIRAPLSILIPWGLHPQEHFIHNNCQRPDVSNAVTEPGFQDIVPVMQGIIIRTEIQEPFLDMVHLKHEPIDDNLIRCQQGDGVHHGPGQPFHNIINDFLESRVFNQMCIRDREVPGAADREMIRREKIWAIRVLTLKM